MSRRRGKQKAAPRRSPPERAAGSLRTERARFRADLERALDFLNDGEPGRAIALLEPHLQRFSHDADLRYALGVAYNRETDYLQALEHLTAVEARRPGPHISFQLAVAYTGLDLDMHALRALLRYIKAADPDDPPLADARVAVADLRSRSVDTARELGTSPERLERARYTMERGRLAVERGDFQAALSPLGAALKMVPSLPPAHHNLALAYFHLDRIDEAIAQEELVLEEIKPDDAYAVAHLIWLLVAAGQRDRATAYLPRLDALLPGASDSAWFKILDALAALRAHQRIYDLLGAEAEDELSPRELNLLGAAAGNLGRLGEARRRFEQALAMEPDTSTATVNLEVLDRGERGWGPEEQLLYVVPFELVPSTVLARVDWLVKQSGKDWALDELKALHARWPPLVDGLAHSLWDADDEELAHRTVDLLAELGTPRAVDHLRAYAFGRRGEFDLRRRALMALSRLGEIEPAEVVRLWDGETWQEIKTLGFQIADDDEEWPYDPETSALLEAAMDADEDGDLEAAAQRYLAVLEREPQAKEALLNLGVIRRQQGHVEQAESLYRQVLDIEPCYPLALCNLARICLDRDDVDQALQLVLRVMENRRLDPDEFRNLQITHATVLVKQEDYAQAREALKTYLSVFPEDDAIREWLARLSVLERMSGFGDWWRQHAEGYTARQRRKPIQGTDLDSLMPRLTKDAYVGMYRALGISGISGLRKAEMGMAIAAHLRDEWFLQRVVERLDDDDRAALRYVLNAGGVLAYAEATARFGDEEDDSPYWNYHEVESTLGRLRVFGLLFVGELEGEIVVVVPDDLQPALTEILGPLPASDEAS